MNHESTGRLKLAEFKVEEATAESLGQVFAFLFESFSTSCCVLYSFRSSWSITRNGTNQ